MPPERCPCGRSGPLFVSDMLCGIAIYRHNGPARYHTWLRLLDGRRWVWQMRAHADSEVPRYA